MPPAGFKRSRALWDEARRPREGKADELVNLLRAILYELQPIRFSQYSSQISPSLGIDYVRTTVFPFVENIASSLVNNVLPRLWSTIHNLSPRQCRIVAGAVFYYVVVRWIHELLEAGPLVMIMTALVGILTIGLGEKGDGELSAYSVFNEGFEQLLGSVDVEHLVNQHVGGGMMVARMMPNDNDNENRHHRHRQRAGRLHGEEPDYVDEEDGHDHDVNNLPRQNRARESGKKARLKNREDKLELRRQREAAMVMGFDGTGGHVEIMAMQRLVEGQQANNDQD